MGDEDVKAKDGQVPGRSRLHVLCALSEFGDGELAVLRELLDAGADPNALDSFDRAPLSLLCMNTGHVEAAKALLASGALPSSQDAWGRASLHWCCDRGWLAIAELLLRNGASVNESTKQGDTPLLWAAKSGHVKLVQLLLKSGCDPLLRNNRDEAPLDVATDEVVSTSIYSAVSEKKSSIRVTDFAPPLQKAEDAEREKPINVEEKAPASPERIIPRTVSSELGSRALAGLPMGAQTGTSGGLLFSAYKKQPMSSTAGSGSGPGPKKMKITLKKK